MPQRRARNEHGSEPVVNQSAGNIECFSRFARRQPLNVHLPPFHFGESCAPVRFRQRVDSQKWFRRHLRLGRAHISVEGGNGARLQVGCGQLRRQQPEESEADQRSSQRHLVRDPVK